jgi:sn-glycerol 3-phosphate transport system ATP-binding protein
VRDGSLHIGETPIVAVAGPDGPVTVGVRPENVEVCPTSAHSALSARVDFCEPLGSHVLVNALLNGAEGAQARIIAQAPPDTLPAADTTIGLMLKAEKIHLFDAETGKARQARERIALT